MRQFLLHNVSWIVFLIALALLISHMVGWKQITVDTTTLLLLALLLVSPFIEQLRKIKVGEFEAEIAPDEVEKVKSEVDKRLGTGEVREPITPEVRSVGESLLDLLDRDHVLALAKLRIELEQALTRLHLLTTPANRQRRHAGLNRLVGDLVRSGILPAQQSGPLQEVISLCNRAVHGEYVRPADAMSIIDIGIHILEEIDSILEEFIVKPTETQPLSPADVSAYMGAKYRVTTVVPLVENPVRNVRILDQEGLDMLLEGYDEYGEFLVSIEKIETQAE
ncbi:MAG: hypothetical protein U9O85_10675 [Euryarchaeota archaeon]|nr:hypothetical protein [Euryarchaeota archaeon]